MVLVTFKCYLLFSYILKYLLLSCSIGKLIMFVMIQILNKQKIIFMNEHLPTKTELIIIYQIQIQRVRVTIIHQ